MRDRLSSERRSWNMSRIRAGNTTPELSVRSFLHRVGIRFRVHDPRLPGKPDLVVPRSRTVVFVHGCFWHRHRRCKPTTTPTNNAEFWKTKFRENVARDQRKERALRRLGWRVKVIWECQAQRPE